MKLLDSELGRRRTALQVAVLVVALAAAVAIPWNLARGVPGDSYRDEFLAESFAGDDGTIAWSTDWIELGEGDGPLAGDVRVESEGHCLTDICLVLGKSGVDSTVSIEREADLSGASAATLQFSFKRHRHGDGDGQVQLAVSANGGSSWTPLTTPASISPHI